MTNDSTFKQKFLDGVIEHVNDDHRDAMRDIAIGMCQASWAVDGELTHFDKEKIQLLAIRADGRQETFEVAFDQPLEKPQQFRPKLIEMLGQARKKMEAQ
ncbi:MAG: DUF2470 domain-containing protein [Bacteroidota bacterium]